MEGMSFRIYGYVLMNNHYHLMLQISNKKLYAIIHKINNKYRKNLIINLRG
jgi:REP element-mobilizing transposase RayT